MAVHRDINPDQRTAGTKVALEAFRAARSAATAGPGTIYIPNADGSGTIIGPGAGTDGTGTGNGVVQWVGDTTPPGRPTGISAETSGGVVTVSWDGTLEGGVPADFDSVSVYTKVGETTALLGRMRRAGTLATAKYADGTEMEIWATAEDAASARDGSPAHNVSERSETVSVTVVDAPGNAVTESYEEYAAGTRDGPADGAEWSRTPPKEGAGVIVWRRTVTKTGDGTVITSEPVPLTGEAAAAVAITADGGTSLRNSKGVTTLRAVVLYGSLRLEGLAQVKAAFGETAAIKWRELPYGGEWSDVDPEDPRLGDQGMTLTVRAEAVTVQATFAAELTVAGDKE